MNVRVSRSVQEVVSALNEPLCRSRSRALTQLDIDAVSRLTCDERWIHVDVERARKGPFGATIAHGYLVLSLIPAVAADLYRLDLGSARLNYRSRTVRFPASAPVNSNLAVASSCVQLNGQARVAKLTAKHTVMCDATVKAVCVAETMTAIVT